MKKRPQLAAKASTLQILRNRRKSLQCRFQFFHDLQRQHVRIKKIGAVFERFIPKSENISFQDSTIWCLKERKRRLGWNNV
jgi:hypothetical protein